MKVSTNSPILVIAVTFESDDSTLRFVQNISTMSKGEYVNIVIVDNSERDDSKVFFTRLRDANPRVICVKTPKNLGYFGGANYGFQNYLKSGQDFDWVIISNVDIVFKDKNFFSNMRKMEDYEGIGVVAPSIWSNKSLHDQNPKILDRPSNRKMEFYRLIYQNLITMNIYGLFAIVKHIFRYLLWNQFLARLRRTRNSHSEYGSEKYPNDMKSIYAPQGACIIFSHRFFDRGGSLDYPMFLFYEEIFVAESARRLGLSIVYNPRLRLMHEDHLSTGLFRSRKMGLYISKSINYVVYTYFKQGRDRAGDRR